MFFYTVLTYMDVLILFATEVIRIVNQVITDITLYLFHNALL